MWPWGHLAVGYLCYVALVRVRDDGEQTLATLLAVAVGTQFPDLVDKPLAWTVGVLPSGRSLAHSLFGATVVILAVYAVSRRRHRVEVAVAFAVGYLSHSVADLGPDVVVGLLQGDPSQLQWTTYLLWPVLASPPYPHDSSFVQHVAALSVDAYVLAQFALCGVALVVWVASGTPGLRTAHRRVQREFQRAD